MRNAKEGATSADARCLVLLRLRRPLPQRQLQLRQRRLLPRQLLSRFVRVRLRPLLPVHQFLRAYLKLHAHQSPNGHLSLPVFASHHASKTALLSVRPNAQSTPRERPCKGPFHKLPLRLPCARSKWHRLRNRNARRRRPRRRRNNSSSNNNASSAKSASLHRRNAKKIGARSDPFTEMKKAGPRAGFLFGASPDQNLYCARM